MKNKSKITVTGLALTTGILSVFPYNVLADTKDLLNVEWSTEFVKGGFESFESLKQTSDGGFVVVGEADVRPEEGGARGDAVIVKYDKNGKKEWYNALIGEDTDLFYDVVEAKDGGFYAIGKSFSSDLNFENNKNLSHAIIVKYDSEGTQEWIKGIHDNGKQINCRDIINTKEGNLAIIGDKVIDGERTSFLLTIGLTGEEVSLVKIKDGDNPVELSNIIEADDNKFIVVGKSVINKEEKPFVSMIDKGGNIEWSYDIEKDEDDFVNILKGSFTSVAQSKTGDIIVSGYSSEKSKNALIMSFDSSGKRLWYDVVRTETSDKYTSVMVNSDGEIVVLGETVLEDKKSSLENRKINITRYSSDASKIRKIDTLKTDMNNISSSKAILAEDNKIVMVGKVYKKVDLGAKCEVLAENLPDECIQADGIIMKIEVKNKVEQLPEEDKKDEENNACNINEAPVINAEDVVINVGEEFKVFLGVTATDKEDGDLTSLLEVVNNSVNTEKAGEYEVVYKVVDKCGISVEKSRKVVVKDKVVENGTPSSPSGTQKPQTGDVAGIHLGLGMASVLGLVGLNKKKNR